MYDYTFLYSQHVLEDSLDVAALMKYQVNMNERELKAMKTCMVLLSSIKANLIMYIKDEYNLAMIWRILKYWFHLMMIYIYIILAQSLKHLFAMCMTHNGNIEAHVTP
jgi:hypothetical protein